VPHIAKAVGEALFWLKMEVVCILQYFIRRSKRRLEDNIKMEFQETEYEEVDWIHVTQSEISGYVSQTPSDFLKVVKHF
jgi:hypothetical protein